LKRGHVLSLYISIYFIFKVIGEVIFKDSSNPKGHKPEDHPLLEMDPYEALDQLIVIDYLWRRIENAKILKKYL
jgi:hypothetical protein